MANRKKLGEILIEEGAITLDALKRGLSHQRQWRGRLGRFLVESKAISEEQLARALAAQSRMPLAKMKAEISGSTTALLPVELCRKHQVIAFGVRTVDQVETVYVAIADPYNAAAMDEVRLRVGQTVKFALAPADEIARAIGRMRSDGSLGSPPGARPPGTSGAPNAKAPGPRRAPADGHAEASADLDALLGLPASPPPPTSSSSFLDDLFDSSRRPRATSTSTRAAAHRQASLPFSSEPDASIFDLSTQSDAVAAYSTSVSAGTAEMSKDAPLELESGAESAAEIQRGFSFGHPWGDSDPPMPSPGQAALEQPLDLDISDTVLPGIELSAEEMVAPGVDPFSPPGEERGVRGGSPLTAGQGPPVLRLASPPMLQRRPPPPDATLDIGPFPDDAPTATTARTHLPDLPELGFDLDVTDDGASPEPSPAAAMLDFPPKEVGPGGPVAVAVRVAPPEQGPEVVCGQRASSLRPVGGSCEVPGLRGALRLTPRPASSPPGPEAFAMEGPPAGSGAPVAHDPPAAARSSDPNSARSLLPELERLGDQMAAEDSGKVTPDDIDFPGEVVEAPALGAFEGTFLATREDLDLDRLLAEDRASLEAGAREIDPRRASGPDQTEIALADRAREGGAVDAFGVLDRLGPLDSEEGLLGVQAKDAGVRPLADLAGDPLPAEVGAPDPQSADQQEPQAPQALDNGELTSDALLGEAWRAFEPVDRDNPNGFLDPGVALPPLPDLQPVSWSGAPQVAPGPPGELAPVPPPEMPAGALGEPVEISSDEIVEFDASPDAPGAAVAEQAARAEPAGSFDEVALALLAGGLGSEPAVSDPGVVPIEPFAEGHPGFELGAQPFPPELPVIPRSAGPSLVPATPPATASASKDFLENLRLLATGSPIAAGAAPYAPEQLGRAIAKLLVARGAISSTDLTGMFALPADQLSTRLVRTLLARAMLGPDDLVTMLTISQDRLNAAVFLRLLERGAVTAEEGILAI